MNRVKALTVGDTRNIYRDPVLLLVTFAPVLIILVVKYGIPLAAGLILQKTGFQLAPHYPLVIGFMILLTPMMFGMVTGFLILEERDQDIITYLSVTPLSRQGYIAYRLTVPIIVSFLASNLFLAVTGLIPYQPLPSMAVAGLVSLEAPIMALFLAAFANNKIEGMALSKGYGVMFIAPFIAYFVHSGWEYAAGIIPPFWVTQSVLFLVEENDHFWIMIICGFAAHLLFIWLLLRVFNRRST